MAWKDTLKNGETRWRDRVWITEGGRRKKKALTAPTKRELDELKDALKQQERRRKVGLPTLREAITFGDLADLFLAQYQQTPRSKRSLIERLKYSRAAFSSIYVRDLVPEQIAAWNAGLTVGPTTKGNALRAMRQVLRFGVECSFLESNPARIKGPAPSKRKINPFESWEQVLAVAAKAGRCGPLIRFACATGLRPQEWQALEWRDIDFNARELHVQRTVRSGKVENAAKTEGSIRTVRRTQPALDALRELTRPLGGGLIFPAPEGGVWSLSNYRNRVWRPALEAAEVEYRALDNTRHTFATLALAAHIPIEWVSKQLGHTNIQTTLKHYARWLPAADEHYVALFDAFAGDGSADGRKTDVQQGRDADV